MNLVLKVMNIAGNTSIINNVIGINIEFDGNYYFIELMCQDLNKYDELENLIFKISPSTNEETASLILDKIFNEAKNNNGFVDVDKIINSIPDEKFY